MPIFWIFSLIFGIVVIANPDIIAYLIGFFFVFLGLNMFVMSWIFRKKQAPQKSWSVGGYEIIRKK